MHVKDKSCKSSGLQAFIKKRPQNGCFLTNIPKVLGTAFFVEQFRLLSFNYVLVSEKIFLKRKLMERLMAFDLNSMFHVQIQEPTCRSTTTKAFVFLIKFAKFYTDLITISFVKTILRTL